MKGKEGGGPNVVGCAFSIAIAGFGLMCISFIPFGLSWSWKAMEGMGMGGQVGQLVIVFVLCVLAFQALLWVVRALLLVLRDIYKPFRPLVRPIVGVLKLTVRSAVTHAKRRVDALPYSPKGYVRLGLHKLGVLRVRPAAAPIAPLGTTRAHPLIPSGDGDARVQSPGDAAGPLAADAVGTLSDPDLDDLGEHPDERAHLVAGVVPYGPRRGRKQYVTGIAAKRGSYKSFLLLDLALALLAGGRWMGFLCKPCTSILYVDLELDAEEFERRAKWVARGRGLKSVPKGWHYLDLSGQTLRVPTDDEVREARARRYADFYGMGFVLDYAARTLRRMGIENALSRWGATTQELILLRARSVGAQAILIDSLTLGGGTSASDEKGWQRLLGGMQFWGLPVVTLDHTSETGHRGMNGSWVKEGLVRSVLEIERDEAGRDLVVTHSKANFAKTREPFIVRPSFEKEDGRIVRVSFSRVPEKQQGPTAPAQVRASETKATIASLFATEKPAPLALPPVTPHVNGHTNGIAVLPAPPPPRAAPPKRGQALGERIDADVLNAINAGCPADKRELAQRLPQYIEKTCANSLARLRRDGKIPRPTRGGSEGA